MKKCMECGKDVSRRKFCSKKCSAQYRSKHNFAISKEDLVQDYTVDRLEMLEISQKRGVSITTLYKYLKRYKIDKRENYIDFAGKRIGQLLVQHPLEVGHKGGGKHIRWQCVCDCGNEHVAYSHHLSRSLTARCTACAAKSRRSELELKNYMWSNIKRGALSRGLEFVVEREYAYQLFLCQNRKCALSGVDIAFAECAFDHKTGKTTASLDRIDSSKGYIPDNIQWVHKVINFIKGGLDEPELLKWCSRIVDYQIIS